jgi:hypothetical protein
VQVIQGAAGTVVVEQMRLAGLQAEVLRDPAAGPVGEGVQRLACQQEVGEQHAQHGSRREGRGAPGQRGQVALEQAGQVEAGEEEADEGGGADFQGLVAQVGETDGVSHGGLRAGAAAVGAWAGIGKEKGGARAEKSSPGCRAKSPARRRFF